MHLLLLGNNDERWKKETELMEFLPPGFALTVLGGEVTMAGFTNTNYSKPTGI